jgi:hypothetical protein
MTSPRRVNFEVLANFFETPFPGPGCCLRPGQTALCPVLINLMKTSLHRLFAATLVGVAAVTTTLFAA